MDLFGQERQGSAFLSACGLYRYSLRRIIDPTISKTCAFIMLNPSTADASQDDPTVRRCLGFAKSWGYGRLLVGNLFALRSTNPMALREAADPVGPVNDESLRGIARAADLLVCAWGAFFGVKGRDQHVLRLLTAEGAQPTALKITSAGFPGHPLYLKGTAKPMPFPATHP